MKKLLLGATNKVAGFLVKGKVVAFPTDTVYGLLANASDKKAVAKLYQIKQRSRSKPLPLFVSSIAMAKKLAFVGKYEESYLKKHWPGNTTFVLRRKKSSILLYGVKKGSIALRIPRYKPLQDILNMIPFPLTATSANISNKNPSNTAQEVESQFRKQRAKPDVLVDGGALKGKPSTIIDLTSRKPKVLRA
ncbi:MAG: L-threonylcarbamoyladenylate synthase [bacterium]|nr:L-threonylcarbamoyladenylate synthase [bacterium]